MNSYRALPMAIIATIALTLTGCAADPDATSAAAPDVPSAASSSDSTTRPGGEPAGGAGGGNHEAMTAAATTKLAQDLGVTPSALQAALTKARSGGAGVNMVKTLSAELNISEATVASGLKDLGPEGP